MKVASYDGVQIKTGDMKDKIAYVEQPIETLGRRAVDLVLSKIKGETVPLKTVLKAKFVNYDAEDASSETKK